MAEPADVLLQLMQEQRQQARQSEDQRTAVTNIVLVVASALLAFITQQGLTASVLPLTIGILLLGLLGGIASAKYYERFALHGAQAAALMRRLQDLLPSVSYEQDWRRTRVEHDARYGVLSRVRLHRIWIVFHGLIPVGGLVLTIMILAS